MASAPLARPRLLKEASLVSLNPLRLASAQALGKHKLQASASNLRTIPRRPSLEALQVGRIREASSAKQTQEVFLPSSNLKTHQVALEYLVEEAMPL